MWAPQPQRLGDVSVVVRSTILDSAARVGADTVAVTASGELTAGRLRRLGWQLEGTDVELVVAPALTDVAGPRIHTRPVAGLPLIHVEAPEFKGGRKVVKELVDRLVAALALLLVAPLCLVIAVLIKLDSRGPVLFRQTRGQHGREFEVRSSGYAGRCARHATCRLTEHDGLLFKIRNDPRVTRVGRWLRSVPTSPQLVNVLVGQMSLVGPRPPLGRRSPSTTVTRPPLGPPGMTGLWQAGRRTCRETGSA